MKRQIFLLLLLSPVLLCGQLAAQEEQEQEESRIPHASMWLKAETKAQVQVPFAYDGTGQEYVVNWGMDTAWDDAGNVNRGTNFIGKDIMTYGRISFQPNDLVGENLELTNSQKLALKNRVEHIKASGTTEVMLNCDHEALNDRNGFDNYKGKPLNWYRCIKASVRYAESLGVKVVSIAPFNEPDYSGWNEGSKDDFKEIARLISEDEELAGIRISAGNTLNCDRALEWYDYMKPYVTEGNTHQLAGEFDSYAQFFTTVRNDGNYATADELHNVMEAMVGIEYGMQGGIWWGYDGVARGDFCKANSPGGQRLGYGENRTAWSAASVYRLPSGKVEAFLGTSERQAKTSNYEFVSTRHDVYYDGYGPTRTFQMEMPGGTAYQTGQTNAERMIQITAGEDVPPFPLEDGNYVIMNKRSRRVLAVSNGNVTNGTSLVQLGYSVNRPQDYEQWKLEWVSSRVGGDFSYFTLKNLRNESMYADLLNYSTSANAKIIIYGGGGGGNEQWFAEYAGDGDYYIRSHHSGLYLEVQGGSIDNNAAIQQNTFSGDSRQRWRFIPLDASAELIAPAAPANLVATPQSASILLSWDANSEEDLNGYMILRAAQDGELAGQWFVIGRMIQGTQFLDNTCQQGLNYSYKVKAIDRSSNLSEASAEATAATLTESALIARYDFEGTLYDETENQMDPALSGNSVYSIIERYIKSGTKSLSLNGSNNYMLMPQQLGNMREFTFATWVYWRGGDNWQRLFDFGNGTNQYMFLTPNNGSEMRFVLKDEGDEQILSATQLPSNQLLHLAVTLSDEEACIYVDGELLASTTDITIRPTDFAPALCYVGRSQFSADPYFKGYLDDMRFYNYALSSEEISQLVSGETTEPTEPEVEVAVKSLNAASTVVPTEYYSVGGARLVAPQKGVTIVKKIHKDGSVTKQKMLQ